MHLFVFRLLIDFRKFKGVRSAISSGTQLDLRQEFAQHVTSIVHQISQNYDT